MLQCFECEDWYHNTHLFPKETSTNIEANWLLICRKCLRTEGYKEALMEYKEYFYPQIKTYLDNFEKDKLNPEKVSEAVVPAVV
tara:strand:+ start:342 stop:593 length:252 start_codon:yes stop_codon:yes gene_type:complete